MKKKTFAILFYVKRTKLLRNGEAPIFMRITVDALRAEMSIQRSIKLSDWNDNKACAKSTNPQNKKLNHYLEHIRHRLYEIQQELEDENKTVTAELLKNRYMGINEANVSFVELYTEHNQKFKELIGKSFTAATLTRHETSMRHVIEFMQYKYNKFFNNKILFYPLEKHFDLPTIFVQIGNSECRYFKIVSQKNK